MNDQLWSKNKTCSLSNNEKS